MSQGGGLEPADGAEGAPRTRGVRSMAWLVREGEVLAVADVACTRAARRRGLVGVEQVEGALVLRPCRQVHTFKMRVPMDVVWCTEQRHVLRIATPRRHRVSRRVVRARFVIEAAAGAAGRWGLHVADVLELAETRRDGVGDG